MVAADGGRPDVLGAPTPTAPGRPSFPGRRDGVGWSGGCWPCTQPLQAGQESLLPGLGPADLQHAGVGVADQPGGQAQEAVASLNLEAISVSGSNSSAVGTNSRTASGMSGVIADITRLIVGWDTPSDSPISDWVRLCRM
jgi:hypothetical protein